MPDSISMKQNEVQRLGFDLKRLSNEQIDGLLSGILQEMRRRDSINIRGDVVANCKVLRKLRSPD